MSLLALASLANPFSISVTASFWAALSVVRSGSVAARSARSARRTKQRVAVQSASSISTK
jgi:hypothetical protein